MAKRQTPKPTERTQATKTILTALALALGGAVVLLSAVTDVPMTVLVPLLGLGLVALSLKTMLDLNRG